MVKTLHITNDMEQLHRLNDFLDESVQTFGLDEAVSMNVKLAVEEVVVNIISYAYPGKKNKDISVRLKYKSKQLIVVVKDSGIEFDPTGRQTPDLSLPLEERPIGGLGTFLVRQMMTEVYYNRIGNRNVLTMIKAID